MAELSLKIGQIVEVGEGRQGTIRYQGALHFAVGRWLGLELPDASGKNNGTVQGEKYFECKQGHGIFVREEAVVKILQEPPLKVPATTNGVPTTSSGSARSRPTSGIVTAEVARKRQSLMSNGSNVAAGSRLSMRSPTKSRPKPSSTSASSTTSTPPAINSSTTIKRNDLSSRSRPTLGARPSTGSSINTARPPVAASKPQPTASTTRSNVTNRPTAPASRVASLGAKFSQPTKMVDTADKNATKTSDRLASQRAPVSKIIKEEEAEEQDEAGSAEDLIRPETPNIISRSVQGQSILGLPQVDAPSAPTSPAVAKNVSIGKRGNVADVEVRSAQQREIEQLKVKIRSLENQRQEDQGKLQDVEMLITEKDRFENIISALQKKLRANQQDMAEVRRRCDEAEAKANVPPDMSGEHESELELATLDKEMAEERAEIFEMELEVVKGKLEELEIEADILREENAELTSGMSAEEKASAGQLHMQSENEKLREALIRLRDVTQENEIRLRGEVTELQEDLDVASKAANLYTETFEKLTRIQQTNKHLMDQLEAMETNDEIVEAMQTQREEDLHTIGRLKHQVQEYEEHLQVADELEVFHVDEEKRLHSQLDENEALLSEGGRRILEQDQLIEELEYHLTKFREMVHGLQGDIDELRRSREISEQQALTLSLKSRDILDQNLTLRSNASKSQNKWIDAELSTTQLQLATKHIEILKLFTLEGFETERTPILALLAFGRIRSKARLVIKVLSERLRNRFHLAQDEEIFKSFQTIEDMGNIAETCYQFEEFLNSCEPHQFLAFSSALTELEPVEQNLVAWIEALRRDELANEVPEQLKRMQNILVDLAGKLISSTVETKITELVAQVRAAETYCEGVAGQLASVLTIVQSKCGPPTDEDTESIEFDRSMSQMSTKARTITYVLGKVEQHLLDLQSKSSCPQEAIWKLFEDVRQQTESLAQQTRNVGMALVGELPPAEGKELIAYTAVSDVMGMALQNSGRENHENLIENALTYLNQELCRLQSKVNDLQVKVCDHDDVIKFESLPAPWTIRAQEIKSTKIISSETRDVLKKLEWRNTELSNKIVSQEKQIEEMSMRVEIAEKRFKERQEKDGKEKVLLEELRGLKSEKQINDKVLASLRVELADSKSSMESLQAELNSLVKTTDNHDIDGATATPVDKADDVLQDPVTAADNRLDASLIRHFEAESHLLRAEIINLQAAIRHSKEENRSLQIPISEVLINAARTSWLSPSLATTTNTTCNERSSTNIRGGSNGSRMERTGARKAYAFQRQGQELYSDLIALASSAKPIRLSSTLSKSSSNDNTANTTTMTITKQSQPSIAQTTRYRILKHREDLERWESQRDDFVSRARVFSASSSLLHPRKLVIGKEKDENQRHATKTSDMSAPGVRSRTDPKSRGQSNDMKRPKMIDADNGEFKSDNMVLESRNQTGVDGVRIVES